MNYESIFKFFKLNIKTMNKIKTHSTAEHFLQVKTLIDLMPGDERISISYDKKSQDWKITGENRGGASLGIYTVLKLSDDFPFLLNSCMSDVISVLVSHYNKIFNTDFNSYREIIEHKGENKVRLEYLNTISSQAQEIEELRKALAKSDTPKEQIPEPPEKSIDKDVAVVDHTRGGIEIEKYSRKKPVRKRKMGKYKVKTRLSSKEQLKAFIEWEKDNPSKSQRGIKTSDVLKELIFLGVTDLTGFITWRISVYENGRAIKGKMSDNDKIMYKKARDRIYHRCFYTPTKIAKRKLANSELDKVKAEETLKNAEETKDNFITNILNKLR